MSFFDKAKQMKQMMEIKKKLDKQSVTVEDNGIKVTISGKLEVTEIELNPEFDTDKQADLLKKLINKANREIQMKMASEMKGMGMGM